MPPGLVGNAVRVGVEAQPPLPRQCDEALTLGAADQRQVRGARQLDTPGGEAGAADQDRYPHLYRLDDHFGGQPPGRVEEFAGGRDAVQVHVACDLVDRIVAADVLHVEQLPVALAQPELGRASWWEKVGRSVENL